MKAPFYPKISVVTPTYNQGKFIEETILSIIGQHYPNLEYIIIDGKSNDETVSIIRKYESYLHYWITEPDAGQSNAINKGFSQATGDIIAWLNSDDLYMPGCLHHIAKQIDTKRQQVVLGNCIHFKEVGNTAITSWGSDITTASKLNLLEAVNYIIQPSSFWTKKAWETVGIIREDMHYVMDWEWFLRAKHKGLDFKFLSKPLSMYRIHGGHKSGTGGLKRQREILELYKIYSSRYAELYQLLLDEDIRFSNTPFRAIKRFRLFMNKPNDPGTFLKWSKAKKYKNFSASEITACACMLF